MESLSLILPLIVQLRWTHAFGGGAVPPPAFFLICCPVCNYCTHLFDLEWNVGLHDGCRKAE